MQKFVNTYGTEKLGIKFDVAGDLSTRNRKISYTLDADGININFYPILNYIRYDMWQTLNPSVVSQMSNQGVYTPQVLPGYGHNYLSVGDGSTSISLTESDVINAYKNGDYLQVGGTWCYWYPFSRGGNNGIDFIFPIRIYFYDISINSSAPYITGNNLINKNSITWVKPNENYTINQSGITTSADDVVKATSNYLRIAEGNKVNFINNKILATDNISNKYTEAGDRNNAIINSSLTSRSGNAINTQNGVTFTKEGTYSVMSLSQMANYIDYNTDVEAYKNTSYREITVNADGTAPSGKVEVTRNKRDKATITIKDYTDGDGVGTDKPYIKYYKDDKEPAIIYPKTETDETVTFENNYQDEQYKNEYGDFVYEIWGKDELGNEGLIDKIIVHREWPAELISLTNTYRVPAINQIITEPVSGPIATPLKIYTGIKTSMVAEFRGAFLDLDFYDQDGNPINNVRFESNYQLYNHSKVDKYTDGVLKTGEIKEDNRITFIGDENAEKNTVVFDFYLPNGTLDKGDKVTIVGTAYSRDIKNQNTVLGLLFYEIRGDARKSISINNIR